MPRRRFELQSAFLTGLAVLVMACKDDSHATAAARDTLTSAVDANTATAIAATAPAPTELCPKCPEVWVGGRPVNVNDPRGIDAQRSWLVEWQEMKELHGPNSPGALYPRERLLRELRDAEELLRELTSPIGPTWLAEAINEAYDEPLAETVKRLRGWVNR